MSVTSKSSQLSAAISKKTSQVPAQTLNKIQTPVVIKTDKGIGAARRSMSKRGFKLTPPKQNSLSSKAAIYTEEASLYSKWENKEPVEYAEYLTKHFGPPDELTEKRAIWYNKDGFKRIEVLDEYILHGSPLPHYDFVYCYVDLKVPHELASKLAESSESITIDFLKNEVGARCASLSANAVTLNYVLDVVEGRIKPSKEEYEQQIKSMKNMFAAGKKFELDWWPDESGDADPKNPYYKESYITFFDFRKKLSEATYKGKKVPLNKPMAGDVKKSKVFVDPDGDGKAQKVNFGDKTMSIKKNIPSRKKSFLARHNCDSKTDKTSAGYWSCKAWK